MPSGPTASILDVPGIGVGHATVWRDEPPPPEGRGIARTGVTVVDPGGNMLRSPIPAGGAVLNGAGECTGFIAIGEWGITETPVFLTSTMQVGRVYDAACELLIAEEPAIGSGYVVIPVVAECDDSFLNDARRMQVTKEDVAAALAAARRSVGGPAPDEGAVGAGTGMTCFDFKGGIGTASRVTPSGHTVGVLLLSNFGRRERLTVDGVPVGRLLPPEQPSRRLPPAGSCIVVVVTDAPVDSAACIRLARRAGLGLARTGSTAGHGSGEIFLALATGLRGRTSAGAQPGAAQIEAWDLDPFFAAVVEATEEAVLNSLLAACTVTGRDGNTSPGLPAERVRQVVTATGHA
jgi:D-aminopeptidase